MSILRGHFAMMLVVAAPDHVGAATLEQALGAAAAQFDLVFAVRAMRIDFRAPARLDDALEVSVALRQCRRASLVMTQEIRRDGELLLDAEVRVAALTASGFRPRPIPQPLHDELSALARTPL